MTFTSFQPNATPTYTLGSRDSIRFAERPMWLSVDRHDDGAFNLTADAEDTTGQAVRVDASWLWDRGIYAPRVTHEDGSNVPVDWVEGGAAYRAEVPHFSEVRWEPSGLDVSAELDVKLRIDGVLSDHTGDETWDAENQTLYIDIGDYLTEIDVLVEQKWVDDHIANLAVWRHNVTNETIDGTAYYVSTLAADETPTLHVLREYQASNKTMFTAGNRTSIKAPMGMYLNVSAQPGNVTIEPQVRAGVDVSMVPLFVNRSYLTSWNISSPVSYKESGEWVRDGVFDSWFWMRANASAQARSDIRILNETGQGVNSTTARCRENMSLLSAYHQDKNESLSDAGLYLRNGTFCWHWALWPGTNISEVNLSHFQVRGRVVNQDNGSVICDISVPASDISDSPSLGAQGCRANRPVPSQINASFRVHAISELSHTHRWVGETPARGNQEVCEGSNRAANLRTYNPTVISVHPVDDLCGIEWVSDGGFGELAPGSEEYKESQEAIITNATRSVNVSLATQPVVNLSDTRYLIADEVVAMFNGSIPDNISDIVDDYGDVKLTNETLNMTVVRTYSANLTDEAINDLDSRNDTLSAHQARYFVPTGHTVNDPLWGSQEAWGDVSMGDAWDQFGFGSQCDDSDDDEYPCGSNDAPIRIAILDSGIYNGHPDLDFNECEPHADFVPPSGPWNPRDEIGHGTYVAGAAAARINNEKLIAGTANVCFTDIQVCGRTLGMTLPRHGICPAYWVAQGILYASATAGHLRAHIVSMSLGCPNVDVCEVKFDPVKRAGEIAYDGRGRLLVAAAGNPYTDVADCDNTDTVHYPARWYDWVAVGSVDDSADQKAGHSACGSSLWLMAPGDTVLTTSKPHTVCGDDLRCETRWYARVSGTSIATPFVSGVSALLYWKHGLDACSIRDTLDTQGTVDLGDAGKDPVFGWGRLDAYKSMDNPGGC